MERKKEGGGKKERNKGKEREWMEENGKCDAKAIGANYKAFPVA